MKLTTVVFCCFLALSFIGFSQEKYTISGTITDQKNGETLIGVSIYLPDTNLGAVTNDYGFSPSQRQKIPIPLGLATWDMLANKRN